MTGQIIQLTMLGMASPGRRPSSPLEYRCALQKRTAAAREAAGLSHEEMAERLTVRVGRDIRADSYRKWEIQGKRGALIPHDCLIPFCDITGTDPYELLTGIPFTLGRRAPYPRPKIVA